MGLIDWLMDSGLEPEQDKMVTGLLKRYGQYQLGEKAGEKLLGKIMPESEDDRLDHENRRLDIRLKQRALGLDNSDDYEDSVNDDTTLYAMTGRHTLQAIPEPGFLSPSKGKMGQISKFEPFLKEATHVKPGPNGSPAVKRLLKYFAK